MRVLTETIMLVMMIAIGASSIAYLAVNNKPMQQGIKCITYNYCK